MPLFPKVPTSDSHSEQQQSVVPASQQSVQQSVQQPAQQPAQQPVQQPVQQDQSSTTNNKRGFFGMLFFIHSFQGRHLSKKKELQVVFISCFNI